ncbi:MAG: hypothetical protein JSW39_02940 [Desulfobacterales bacterium]|nr:MAG: hypothetical protein JSW39_02940 [Desulfobacterales bacterium]
MFDGGGSDPSPRLFPRIPVLVDTLGPVILPGCGPKTRTVMQVKVNAAPAGTTPTPSNLAALESAFPHKAEGSGVFEAGPHPIIVGQAAYNSAYGTSFAASSYCNGGSTSTSCDGYARIADQGGIPP